MLNLAEIAVESGATSLTLEVRISNLQAQALYKRFGMAPVGVRKRYYRDEDALVMWVHDIHGEEYQNRLEEIEQGLQ
jgi:ribosomal-protein-alanine N-acetyltransferase